ncbi:MAG: hypothetical protein ACI9IT_001056 [Glaciecola sp.]|jgi:hypothetical protein
MINTLPYPVRMKPPIFGIVREPLKSQVTK